MRVLKIVGGVIAALVIAVVAVALAIWLAGGPVLAWALEYPASALLGRSIRVAGPAQIRWGSPAHLTLENVTLANADWSSTKDMFSAKRLDVDFFPASLLHRRVDTENILLDGAQLHLETSREGERNWDFALRFAVPQKRGQVPMLRHAQVHESEISYRNGGTGATTTVGISNLDVKAPGPTTPVTIAGQGTLQGQPIEVAGTVGPLAELRNPQKPYPVRFEGTLDRTHLTVNGTMAKPLDVAGADLGLSLRGTKLGKLGQVVGVPMPELPDVQGTGRLKGGNGKWQLDDLKLALGNSDLEGGIDVDTTPTVPRAVANLTSRRVDLADFKGVFGARPAHESAPTGPHTSKGRVLPDTHLAVEKLVDINAELGFEGAEILSTGGMPIQRISVNLKLQNGELTIKPLRFRMATGDADMSMHFTPFTKDSPPRLTANLDIRHIDLHKLLDNPKQPAMLRSTAGLVAGFAKLEATGTSMRELATRMNGDVGIFMENGQMSELLQDLVPLDVAKALSVYVRGDKPVPINCLISRFAVKDGIAEVSTLLVDTADTVIRGEGSVNFPSETVFITLVPYNKSTTAVAGQVPIDVHGTFAHPTVGLRRNEAVKKVGEVLGLGVLFPPAALVPLVDTGLGPGNRCGKAFAQQPPPGKAAPQEGSSKPPQ